MEDEKNTCQGCYWEDKCSGTRACEDYTPINDEDSDIAFYNNILRENVQEYEELVKEQNS